jgi:hypothetical protein
MIHHQCLEKQIKIARKRPPFIDLAQVACKKPAVSTLAQHSS